MTLNYPKHNGNFNILTFSLWDLFPNGLFTLFLSDAVFNWGAFTPSECRFVKAGLAKSSPSAEGREKKELNLGRKGERSDTRGGTQNSTLTQKNQKATRSCGSCATFTVVVGRLTDKYADGCYGLFLFKTMGLKSEMFIISNHFNPAFTTAETFSTREEKKAHKPRPASKWDDGRK